MVIKETNGNKLGNRERRRASEVFKEVSTSKIIDFALGRKALEKGTLDEEQSRARLVERIRLPGRLSGDWLEFSLTMAMFLALLLAFMSDSLVRGGSDQSHRRALRASVAGPCRGARV